MIAEFGVDHAFPFAEIFWPCATCPLPLGGERVARRRRSLQPGRAG